MYDGIVSWDRIFRCCPGRYLSSSRCFVLETPRCPVQICSWSGPCSRKTTGGSPRTSHRGAPPAAEPVWTPGSRQFKQHAQPKLFGGKGGSSRRTHFLRCTATPSPWLVSQAARLDGVLSTASSGSEATCCGTTRTCAPLAMWNTTMICVLPRALIHLPLSQATCDWPIFTTSPWFAAIVSSRFCTGDS